MLDKTIWRYPARPDSFILSKFGMFDKTHGHISDKVDKMDYER